MGKSEHHNDKKGLYGNIYATEMIGSVASTHATYGTSL